MGGWWIADVWRNSTSGPVIVVSWLFWVVFSIVLHELSHGWAALRMGDTTPRDTGHMTWNPLVHMGGFSLVALALVGIAWGAMPVDPSRMRGRHAEAIVAAAGPAMNLLIAILTLIALVIWVPLAAGDLFASVTIAQPLRTNLELFLRAGAMLNLVLLMFNLLPAMPLDGGRIAAHYIRPYREFVTTEHGMWISMGLMLVFFWFASGYIIPAGRFIVDTLCVLCWTLMGVSP